MYFFLIYIWKKIHSWPRVLITRGNIWPRVIMHVSSWTHVIIHVYNWTRV
jgi:hypothetical protein